MDIVDGLDRRAPPGSEPGIAGLAPESRALRRVFEALDRAEVPYCVTHGYEGYPGRIGSSDVDIVCAAEWPPEEIARLLGAALGGRGELVGLWDGYMVAAGRDPGCPPWFLALDFRPDYTLGHSHFCSGADILAGRRRKAPFWIAAPDAEFACRLLRRMAKRRLDDAETLRLGRLYRQDPGGCERRAARLWGSGLAGEITFAAFAGYWEPVKQRLAPLYREARMRALLHRPLRTLAGIWRRWRRRARLAAFPEGGLSVVLLGPDGAGKSSVASALAADLAPAFSGVRRASFPPALLQRLHRPCADTVSCPHALPVRSPAMSALRALGYWSVHHLFCFRLLARLRAARSVLTVHDRHLVDALVDPRRYRYGGPMRLLHAIWWLGPRPDLVILLDAPPEVLQQRKQEVPFAETARQCRDYRQLVAMLPQGHIIAADRPFDEVVRAADDLILRTLAARLARRLRRRRRGSRGIVEAAVAEPAPPTPLSPAEP